MDEEVLVFTFLLTIGLTARRSACINSILTALVWVSAPILVSVASFLVYVYHDHQLTASIAFTVSFG